MAKTPTPIIIHEDSWLVVLAKPPQYHTLPDRFRHDIPNLRQWLLKRYQEIFIVHRLDHDTSGVIIVAKTAEAHRTLSLQFENRQVEKVYHAVVVGHVEQDEFTIDIPLLSDPSHGGRVIPSARGKESLTHVRVLERFRIATLLECKPVTGRQHQVRVHLAAAGYPLIVDPLYGAGEGFYLSGLKARYKQSRDKAERPIIARATLHAYSLTFSHPATHERVSYTAEYPKDFRALLHVLHKYASIQRAFSGQFGAMFDNL